MFGTVVSEPYPLCILHSLQPARKFPLCTEVKPGFRGLYLQQSITPHGITTGQFLRCKPLISLFLTNKCVVKLVIMSTQFGQLIYLFAELFFTQLIQRVEFFRQQNILLEATA